MAAWLAGPAQAWRLVPWAPRFWALPHYRPCALSLKFATDINKWQMDANGEFCGFLLDFGGSKTFQKHPSGLLAEGWTKSSCWQCTWFVVTRSEQERCLLLSSWWNRVCTRPFKETGSTTKQMQSCQSCQSYIAGWLVEEQHISCTMRWCLVTPSQPTFELSSGFSETRVPP